MNNDYSVVSRDSSHKGSATGRWRPMTVAPGNGHAPIDHDPANGLLIERFEKLAGSTPGQTALVTNAETLTLAELNAQANAVAYKLLNMARPPNSPVALFAAHGAEKVAAAIGNLKTTAAFVSVDPKHANQAARDHFSHTKSTIVLADKEHLERATANRSIGNSDRNRRDGHRSAPCQR